MRITQSLENLTASRSLYCVWVPAREGEPTSLVARWIDPRVENSKMREDDDRCAKNEARQTWLGMSSRAA